jgi:hypothetical protein
MKTGSYYTKTRATASSGVLNFGIGQEDQFHAEGT